MTINSRSPHLPLILISVVIGLGLFYFAAIYLIVR